MPTKQTLSLVLAKLQSSGLDETDFKALRLKAWDGAETEAISPNFRRVPTLEFPYLDPWNGWKPLAAAPKWPPMRRFRYLEDVPDPTKKGKLIRYAQPPDTGACAYFPPTVDWPAINADTSISVLITEGELKAAKACKEGFPTIGLGGVHNFRSVQARTPFLPELEAIDWAQRKVVIVFDSDVLEKEGVRQAINALAGELRDRGAIPCMLLLPPAEDGGKQGLDDWFVAGGTAETFRRMVEHSAQDLTLARPLFQLNDEFVMVKNPTLIVQVDTGGKLAPAQFLQAYGNRKHHELKVTEDGVSMVPKPAAKAWMEWPMRRTVNQLVFEPGMERFCEIDGRPAYNTWGGWATEPKKGNVDRYLRLVDHLFSTAPKEVKEWFLRWCALPIQRPGTKLYSAVAIHGVKTGTGKSFLFYALGRIYGKHFTEIRERDLQGSFNGWAQDKQLVLGDDVTGSDKRSHADQLKAMITQKTLWVNQKFVPSFEVRDCVNYAFTSNQPDAFFLEDADRRFFVHEVTVDPLPAAFYHDLEGWLDTPEGGGALHHYLLNLPLGSFDHRSRAMDTASKQAMVEFGRSDLAAWVHRLLEDPERHLVLGQAPVQGDLFSARELIRLYDPAGSKGVTAMALGKALVRAQAVRVAGGQPVRWRGGQDRYFAVRHGQKWASADAGEVRKHLEKTK